MLPSSPGKGRDSQDNSQDDSKHYSSAESAHHPWKMQYIRGIYNTVGDNITSGHLAKQWRSSPRLCIWPTRKKRVATHTSYSEILGLCFAHWLPYLAITKHCSSMSQSRPIHFASRHLPDLRSRNAETWRRTISCRFAFGLVHEVESYPRLCCWYNMFYAIPFGAMLVYHPYIDRTLDRIRAHFCIAHIVPGQTPRVVS